MKLALPRALIVGAPSSLVLMKFCGIVEGLWYISQTCCTLGAISDRKCKALFSINAKTKIIKCYTV